MAIIWDTFKEWFLLGLFDWATKTLSGKETLIGVAMMGAARFWGWYKNCGPKWQHRAQIGLAAFVIYASFSAGNFLYMRWIIDPRAIPQDKIAAFKAALGSSRAYDNRITVIVSCFRDDPSSCALASKYNGWFSDHWGVLRSPHVYPSTGDHHDLLNRVWIETQDINNRPNAVRTLREALDDAGMNTDDPGYRLNSSLDEYHFGFVVGPSR
jgi:hypothetical protein